VLPVALYKAFRRSQRVGKAFLAGVCNRLTIRAPANRSTLDTAPFDARFRRAPQRFPASR